MALHMFSLMHITHGDYMGKEYAMYITLREVGLDKNNFLASI